ncbi:hypothetical protein H2203_000076 [Taxawa tesnikishii (nom. ined.)]|nr:hypothetical protein H2203_000076 [Dothideales sp. JES 119]
MRRISPLERSLDQLLAPNSSRSVCRSCRLRVISQRRNLHTTQPQQAFTDRLFGRKEKVPEAQQGGSVTEADRYEAEAGQRASGSAGGRRGRVAERIDPTKEPEYIVATSWEGLERIGGEKWIEESLDQGDTYVGWGKKKESNPNRSLYQEAQLKRMLRDTAVEVFALRDAGRNIMEVCNPRQVEGDNPFANDVGVSVGKGELNLAFKDLQQRDLVLENIMTSEQLEEADRLAEEQLKQQETGAGQEAVAAVGEVSSEPVQSESASAQVQQPTAATATKAIGADDKWLVLGLADPAIKFAITKRMIQLTGLPISDFTLSTTSTLFGLLEALVAVRRPKAKKLAPQLKVSDAIAQLPNVKVASRRITPIDKEKEVGRWKLIQQELLDRGLPVTGSNKVHKALYKR